MNVGLSLVLRRPIETTHVFKELRDVTCPTSRLHGNVAPILIECGYGDLHSSGAGELRNRDDWK